MQANLGPDHDLAVRLSTMERNIAALQTRDVLQNASIGVNGLLVEAGGSITVTGGGSITVSGGGTLYVNGVSVASLIAGAISPQVNQTSATGFTLTTSDAAIASFNLTVPAGYTRALVTAAGSITSFSNYSGGEYVYTHIQIGGVNGPSSSAIFNTTYANIPCISSSAAQSISGLAGGALIPVTLLAHLTTGPGSSTFSSATLTASVLFLT